MAANFDYTFIFSSWLVFLLVFCLFYSIFFPLVLFFFFLSLFFVFFLFSDSKSICCFVWCFDFLDFIYLLFLFDRLMRFFLSRTAVKNEHISTFMISIYLSIQTNTHTHKLIYIIIIIMSRCQHGYPWPSLTTPPYQPLLPAGPQGYIPYRHRAAVCRFELVVLPLHVHMKGSTGVHY